MSQDGTKPSLLESLLLSFAYDPVKREAGMPTREAYGLALRELGRANPNIVVVDADLGKSTFATLFKGEFPERFFECGVAEQNMMGIAAGLAASGKIPFASTFAVFASSRAFDQIRVGIAQPRLNVKIMGSHSGLITGEDGKSAQAIEDLALMCALPNFRVIVPADGIEAAQAVEVAAEEDGPFYIRCCRPSVPFVYGPDYRFTLGRGVIMHQGSDVTIIAIGIMVKEALDAADRLAKEGISCRVINMPTLKPLDQEMVIQAAEETGAIVTAEEHLEQGSLGSLVAQVLAKHCPTPMGIIAIRDMYGQSGKPRELLEWYGLTADHIVQEVRSVLKRKRG